MLGAIIGDIIGSQFEFNNHRSKKFDLFSDRSTFTDDTVCTVATMEWLLACNQARKALDYTPYLQKWCIKYPDRSYGEHFASWIKNPIPYNSYGNGAGMRVSPIGKLFTQRENVLEYAMLNAIVSHNHPEGIKGAQAIALAVFLADRPNSKESIRTQLSEHFGYNLTQELSHIRLYNRFDETCPVTVPQAIIAFLESVSFEDAIRNAISIGGDSDTIAAMTGAIAEQFYRHIPDEIVTKAKKFLPEEMLQIIQEFNSRISCKLAERWKMDGDPEEINEATENDLRKCHEKFFKSRKHQSDINLLSFQEKSFTNIQKAMNLDDKHQVYAKLNNLIQQAKKDNDLQATIIRTLGSNENETAHYLITKSFHTHLNQEYQPSVKELEIYDSIWKKEANHQLPANAIFKLCAQYPNNTKEDEILLKISVINDLYGTKIFSKVTVAKHIKEFEDIDNRIKSGDKTLINKIQTVQIENKNLNFYSFFSKYCHFHNPENFPIYDSFIEKVLYLFLKKNDFRKDKHKKFKIEELKNYVTFCTILSDFKEHYGFNQTSATDLDKYLWLLGKDMFPPNY